MDSQISDAINPITGEIDWDCPCIAGMLGPPCGDIFKRSLECYAKSHSEPKGMECIHDFTLLKNCYLAHKDVVILSLKDVFSDDLLLPTKKKHTWSIATLTRDYIDKFYKSIWRK